jgi:hemoglobin
MTMSFKRLACAGVLALVASAACAQAADDAVFRGLGGKPGIKKIVGNLIPLVLADARIKESFQDIDMKNLALRLEEQFCVLSGGPCVYKGKEMADIHDGLNITNAQFNALAEDLQVAMEQAGVASRVQNKLMAKLAPMQHAIVTK